jgi:predicted Zn-dependent protease
MAGQPAQPQLSFTPFELVTLQQVLESWLELSESGADEISQTHYSAVEDLVYRLMHWYQCGHDVRKAESV